MPRNKPPCPPYRKKQSGIWKPESVLLRNQSQTKESICQISKFCFWDWFRGTLLFGNFRILFGSTSLVWEAVCRDCLK
ncbi:hypothetical protein BBW65_07465 [Helicobacter enhydrae]|uniref:Uncharacterized protein n=1 Tax=Helicobacter enhydrae TaxID=222136 RepID=A0A1B1U7J5_9HELI|nr:hypothetical protein BBW65_07465 [Helicobacter enhydrae]